MAAVLREAGGGFGAGGLKSVASRVPRFKSKEVSLNWNTSIRQIHRWLSIVFTATVIANFVAMGLGEPPALVVYSPLLPLFLLLFTGLYMFVLPYAAKLRGVRGAG
jgi:cellulose synthase/poly-beta-1,6-N-acetylglucosamine synthase-like glycosyltransferase